MYLNPLLKVVVSTTSELDSPVWTTPAVILKACRLLSGQNVMFRAHGTVSEHAQQINKQLDMPEKASFCLHKAVVWTN